MQCSAVQCSAVQCSAVQCSAVQNSTDSIVHMTLLQQCNMPDCFSRIVHITLPRQYSTVQYSTVQYSTVQYSTVQYSTVQYSTVQYSTVQYSTVQYSTAQHSTAQHSTAQHSTAQHSVQHSTAQYIYNYLNSTVQQCSSSAAHITSPQQCSTLDCPSSTYNLTSAPHVQYIRLFSSSPHCSSLAVIGVTIDCK